jgi:hypothetical protein
LISLARPLLARLDAQAEGDVLEHRHVAEQRVVLEDEADVALAGMQVRGLGAGEQDLALSAVSMPAMMRSSGLAAAGRAEQGDQFAGRDVEVDVVERDEIAEALGDVADFDTHRPFVSGHRHWRWHQFGIQHVGFFFMRHSTMVLATSVTSASRASTEAAAKAPMALYSL